jgi:amino acid adenylation domain-containing protein
MMIPEHRIFPNPSGFMSVPAAVTAHARKTPDAPAVVAGPRVLNYRDLDSQSSRVARYLCERGARADLAVGLCLPRSIEMVVAALGILKSGAAYLPMDPAYPTDRLSFMLDDSQAPLMMTSARLAERFRQARCEVIDIGAPQFAEGPNHFSSQFFPGEIALGNLAYMIYTSGSTGRPKGVEVEHASLVHLIDWHLRAFNITSSDRASHVAGLGFDAAIWELWPYLSAGASVHLVDEVSRGSAELLRDWIVAARISIAFVSTPIAEWMIRLKWPRETALRILLTGADTLHHFPPIDLPFELVNNYGPTECTVVATSGKVPRGARSEMAPPIGRPIAKTRIYLLNERLEQVADGEAGEMHIGGPSLARGYHNLPDLTQQKFIANPFGEGRLYRTGDLARRLPDGQLAFAGRVDDQIKLRGYRIEPGEIVNALNRHPIVRDSAVHARLDATGEKRLVAYLITDMSRELTHTGLRNFLRDHLPEYMLPSIFVTIDAFPVTANGKIDYAALPEPQASNTLSDDTDARPETEIERRIAAIITSLLGTEGIGRNDNFFLLGGHSLLGAQLIAKLRDAFGVDIALRALFDAPTVSALAVEIERLSAPAPQAAAAQS